MFTLSRNGKHRFDTDEVDWICFFEILSLIIERTHNPVTYSNLSSSSTLHTLYIIHYEVNTISVTGCQNIYNISYKTVSHSRRFTFKIDIFLSNSGAYSLTHTNIHAIYYTWVWEKFQERPHIITKKNTFKCEE